MLLHFLIFKREIFHQNSSLKEVTSFIIQSKLFVS
ncbi:unnamed protein product [Brassica rapa]|uniref:Uncharacterized protein n=1 Tax=Brassica campestris TaxID=3711 RepID=A0A8D9HGE3_BRACM|nr:unnamed protein product [Brassica rapa]